MTSRKTSQPAQNLTGLLDCLVTETSGETVTLGQLMGIVERRSFGAVILLLGLIAVSPLTIVPGATWAVAAATLLFSVQLLFGLKHPMMSRKLFDLKMPRPALETFVKTTRNLAHVADKLTAPRLGFLTRPPFVIGVALVCTIAALVTFPLGLIPLGPVLPGISILLMGIGLTARDGVFLLLSTLAMAGAVLLVVRWLT
ncbi:MAG: exopolysaccharide biosynthesis protein [Hyphomonadaceae bacterium]|nr:exopolysaccharide biosynthesis protein [Hyphomonadaceae bacterium]